ncbi:MAG: TRAP transporter large permease subunit [Synergistaceae bacterium]|nr:TRAP transporter large permease subunit [Synergistaceae bacterium]
MKKFITILFTAILALSLCATGLFAAEAETPETPAPASSGFKFDHKIIIVCPWGEGGGADSTLRAITPLIKEATGQEVEVLNITGGNGVNGASYVREHEADGYTFMLGTQSLLIQDVMGAMPFKFMNEFVPVARLVHAIDVIATSRRAMEERGFKTFSELRDYIKAHPFSVSIGMLTRIGVDGLSFQQATEGLNILEVDYPTGGGMTKALTEGQIDLMVTGTQEVEDLIQAGEIIPLLVLAEKRMNRYPQVECAKDLGINAFLGSERGLFAKKGTPQEAIDALRAIVADGVKTEAWNDFLQQGGYDERPGYADAPEYQKALDDEYKTFTDMLKPAKASDKKAAPAPSPKLAIIGFVMVLVLIICLIKKIIIPPIAFILLPTIAALVAGFDPLVVNKFAASGISKMVSTVSLFVFSISFFSLMSDQGVFDPIVNFLIKKAGTNVTLVLLATAAVAVIGHLDGSGATTFIITITAMLPLFKKLKMDNRALMMLICVAIGVMNVCPWGGPTIRAATVLETDPNLLWHRLLPVQGAMLVITFVIAILQSGIQRRRIKKLGLTIDDTADETKAEDKGPKVSTALQWYNFLIVVAVIVILMMGLLNPAYTFMLALALTLPFNIKSLKEQNAKLKNYGVAAMSMVVTLFAAGIFTGVLSGTGMLNAMASAVVTVIPPDLGRYTHFIVACFAVPLIMCLGTDSFYFGLLPVVVGIASQFGVNPMDVACVLLVAENVGVMISPLSPAMYLGLGLLEIDVGEHIKYSLVWIWGVSLLAIAACIVLGVTPL